MNVNRERWVGGLLVLATMAVGCSDEVSCPEGTVLAEGVCAAGDDLGVGDMGECVPSGDETCDGTDEDCDGMVDEGLETMSFFTDADEDGFGDDDSPVEACGPMAGLANVGGDCDDSNADANPDGTESCDGIDDDCDGATDEGVITTVGAPMRLMLDDLSSSTIAMVPAGDELVVAYRATDDTLRWVTVDLDGTVTGGPHEARVADDAPNDPVLAVGGDGRVLLAWSEDAAAGGRETFLRYLDLESPATPGPAVSGMEDRRPNDLVFYGDQVFLFAVSDTQRLDVRSFASNDLSSPSAQVFIRSGFSIRAATTDSGFLQAAFVDYTDSVATVQVDRIVPSPLGPENVPEELVAEPASTLDLAFVERGDASRILAAVAYDSTKELYLFDPQELGTPPTPILLDPPGDLPTEAQSIDVEAHGGSFDVVLCGEPGYQCSYRNVALDGAQSEPGVFSMAGFIPDGEVARVSSGRGAVVYSGSIAGGGLGHDLYFQPIGCR